VNPRQRFGEAMPFDAVFFIPETESLSLPKENIG
jgi:hypothetical protein